jgi:acetyl coenzyme A synthetase (ADP forming)-like protein
MDTSDPSLTPFFSPKGIVLIGASQNPVKLGYGLARNLVLSNFQGAVHFVNPNGGSLFVRMIHPRIAEIPDPADIAILLIPADAVPGALRECGQRGLKAAIIGSGGFRETGPAGARLEEECVQIAVEYGMRLLGPNCIGLLDTHIPLDATFLPPPGPLPGDVAFISHSGAICAAVIDWARGQGFGLSRLVSLGNQADVNETDVLSAVANDPFTRVLTLYLEGVSDGRRFVEEAGRVARRKPVIALKVGRYKSGQRAVASHTGALAGQESAFNAAFRRAGVIRADTSEEMFDWARALAWSPLPEGRSMAVLTNAGGPGVTAADALEANGLNLAQLKNETTAALRLGLPPAASLQNPVDMLASATPEQYASCLNILLADANTHGVLVILPPPPTHTAGAIAKALIPVIHASSKPVMIALMGERLIQEAVEHFRAARIPEYRFPERAASALAVLVERAEFLSSNREAPVECNQLDAQAGRQLLSAYISNTPLAAHGFLAQDLTIELAKVYGIPSLPTGFAATREEALRLAQKLGYPVAMKIASEDIAHKSDAGGVLLSLADAKAVSQGFITIMENARKLQPQAEIQGVFLQPMVSGGQDVIIGAVQDPQFGPLVMFGSGGVEVEGLRDVAFALAPLTQEEADFLLEKTWAGRRLRGYRNLPRVDRRAVIEILTCVSQLVADLPELSEIEINPLRVFAEGQGAMALDIRARARYTRHLKI